MVYQGLDTDTNQSVVIKVLKPVQMDKIQREIMILYLLKGGPNIVEILDVVMRPDSDEPSLVMELVDCRGIDPYDLYANFSDAEGRSYMYKVLQAMDYANSKGVYHRDLKPGNVMYDPQTQELRMIDWGLADFYNPNIENKVGMGTRVYKAPEMLVGVKSYDYGVDMWSIGCMMSSLIFKGKHMFRGSDNFDQVDAIAQVLGTQGLYNYVDKFGVTLSTPI